MCTSGVLEKPLEKKAGRKFAPPSAKRLIYFIDDLNMPEVDIYGTVQPHTLIRQHLDYKHWWRWNTHTINLFCINLQYGYTPTYISKHMNWLKLDDLNTFLGMTDNDLCWRKLITASISPVWTQQLEASRSTPDYRYRCSWTRAPVTRITLLLFPQLLYLMS